MLDHNSESSKSDPDGQVSEAARKKIDSYTVAVRNFNKERKTESWFRRSIAKPLENANRKLWSRLFEMALHNSNEYSRIPLSELKSVLVIPVGDAIGDLIVALPIFRAIKRRNPHCRTGVFVSERNETLLRCDPDVDDRYLFRDRFDFAHYSELLRARKVGYQVVINLHFVRMTEYGILANIVSPGGLKVSTRHGKHDRYRAFFNRLASYDRDSMHLAQLGLVLLNEVVDYGTSPLQAESRPTLSMCPDTRRRVEEAIGASLKQLNASWFIYFNTQARFPLREWTVEKTAEFSRRFAKRYPDGAIFYTSSPVRRAEVEREIKAGIFERSIYFPTSYDLLEIAALAERSRLVITPDTSVIHMGVAANRPTIVLWTNKNDLPMDWIPLQVPSKNLAPPIVGDPVSTISVDEVWNATIDLLEHPDQASQTSFDPSEKPSDLYQASCAQEPLTALIERTLTMDTEGFYRRT